MADAKTPTRPPPGHSRRSRRDPREESTPPPGEEPDEARGARREPISRTNRAALPTQEADLATVLGQVEELEDEIVRLHEQKENDEAMMGQMLARVADREQEAREARTESVRFGERAALAEARAIHLEAQIAELEDQAARATVPNASTLASSDADVRVAELRATLARAVEEADAAKARAAEISARTSESESRVDDAESRASEAESRAAMLEARRAELEAELAKAKEATSSDASAFGAKVGALEARIAELEGKCGELERERLTAVEIADELAEKVETLEMRVEGAETTARAARESREGAEARLRAQGERLSELESEVAIRDGKLDAAEMRLHEALERVAAAEMRTSELEARTGELQIHAVELEARAHAGDEEVARTSTQLAEAKAATEQAQASLTTMEERDWRRAEELAAARASLDEAKARAAEIDEQLAERARELSNLRAEQRSSEAALKKRHEESLGQQKSMFERQLTALESQLAEAKGGRERAEQALKDLRVRAQEMEAEQASLEERLTIALDDRDTASRHLETMKEDGERAARDLAGAARDLAIAREMLARAALAMNQLETLESEAALIRERAFHEARAALTTPGSLSQIPLRGDLDSLPPPSKAPETPAPPTRVPEGSSVPERPAPGARAEDLELGSEVEVSFASLVPPGSTKMRAVTPHRPSTHPSVRPSGRPTPERVQAVRPITGAPSPLSDPEIRVSLDDDEG